MILEIWDVILGIVPKGTSIAFFYTVWPGDSSKFKTEGSEMCRSRLWSRKLRNVNVGMVLHGIVYNQHYLVADSEFYQEPIEGCQNVDTVWQMTGYSSWLKAGWMKHMWRKLQ